MHANTTGAVARAVGFTCLSRPLPRVGGGVAVNVVLIISMPARCVGLIGTTNVLLEVSNDTREACFYKPMRFLACVAMLS
jgi:hypothetical protein